MPITDNQRQDFYKPGRVHDKAIDARKELFDELAKFIARRNGWITSIPGAADVWFECLPHSSLPDELRELGKNVVEEGEGERILPQAIEQRFIYDRDGALMPMPEGSTAPIAMCNHHAGIARVLRYSFRL